MRFDWEIYANPLNDWLIAVAITLTFYIIILIFKRLASHRIAAFVEKTETHWDDLAVEMLQRIHPLFVVMLSIYLGALALSLPKTANQVLTLTAGTAVLFQVGILMSRLIGFFIERYKRSSLETDPAKVTTITSAGVVLRFLMWIILLLIALDTFGIDITTLIAGLGIGGIAVALAVQNILGDLFASLSILLDKPFVIGDFIIVDDHLGTVEHIGLKTTRIRSLSGEQLVFSNTDLLKSRIRNYKRMYERRVVFAVGVLYQTAYEKLSHIPDMIRTIIEQQQPVRFDRAHFKAFGDYALNFEVVYWIQTPDYNAYMDIQQVINLEIYKQFKEHGIEFAYPTQTLFLKPEAAQLNENVAMCCGPNPSRFDNLRNS